MPPQGGNKRKRGDRTYSEDDFSRPSPHRPGNLDLARQSQSQSPTYSRNGQDTRGRGNRRGSRGGRHASDLPRQSISSPMESQSSSTKISTPNAGESTPVPVNIAPTPDVQATTSIGAEQALVLHPYKYAYLTDDVKGRWNGGGRLEVEQQLDAAITSEDELTAFNIVQELIHAATSQAVLPQEAGEVLRTVLNKHASDPDVSSALEATLLDSLSIAFENNSSLQRDAISEFIVATDISEDVLRQEFDQDLLQKLGMIRSTFGRMGIRKQTNVLYRQANFNLMREESEGFAKLMTELFTTSGNEPPTGEVVEETVERVKAMIGAFDLDVGRSLDVVLDVFGAVLVKQFRFFVKFLRASPWWPRTDHEAPEVEISGGLPRWANPGVRDWKLSEAEQEEVQETARARDAEFWPQAREDGLRAFQQIGRVKASAQAVGHAQTAAEDDAHQQWIKETGTMPPSANRDAAQLLGFKLRFYSSSAARDSSDILPDHLIYLSALLIKIGFISLNDLYPHIWRSDEEMEELKLQKVVEKVDRERAARPGAGVKNALLLAGALSDDTGPALTTRLREPATRSGTPAREPEVEKPTPRDPSMDPADQKVLLLKSLLAIGALPEALFILGRFPWILDLYPELPEYIHRIMHHSLSHVYDSLRPLQTRSSLSVEKPIYETDVPGVTKGQVRLAQAPQKRVLRWAQLDRDDSSDGTDYRFYWDEWNDNIPICQTVEDVFTLCQTILPLVGVKIGQDPSLILKLTRIGKHSLNQDSSEQNRNRWLDLVKRVLLPSLSLTKPNAGVVNEVFEFISHYPTNVRYVMYLEWSSGRVSRNPDVKAAFDQAKAETKDVLKRISKTNVKPMARSLAKIAYANPHVVITTALAQIEVYDSIAEVFVEGSRYFTDLGYDLLNWALISSMARAGRSRTQDGGIFTSRWLSALSQFAGKIYKRYSMMKPGPVLQYVSEQLDRGNTTDLKMLEQIIVSMAGIATDNSFNDAQLQAMGGGPLLQSQTILQLLDRRNDSKTSSRRLVKALQDHGLGARFLLSMAQQRQACVFEEADVPLKAIGNTFDETHRIMHQYLDLLRSNLSFEDFQKTVPDIVELLVEYEIPADVAFWIARPVLAKQMAEYDKSETDSQKINGTKEAGTDADMTDANSSEEDGEAVETEDVATTVATPSEIEISETLDTEASEIDDVPEKWNPVLRSVMDRIQDHLPNEIIDKIGVGFYVTFWQLSLYDINVPSKSYEDEMNRQRKKISSVTADRTNITASGAKQRESTVKVHQQLIDDLLAENKDHLKSYSESRSRLQKEKDQWFANKQRQSAEINAVLMEYCFLPRILSSPQDAFFCFKFVKFLHSNGTPNFRTLGFYDSFLKADRLASLIFMCTSKESDNLGRFLCELLRDLGRWHKDKNVYEREAFGSKKNLPGFAMKVENGKPQLLLDFEKFRQLLFKWHSDLFSALTKCLSSPEYMHVRNAISVLRSVSAVYPSVNFHGSALQRAVDKLRNSDREDLKVSSQALLGALHRREKEWVIPQAFRQGRGPEKMETDQKAETPKLEAKEERSVSAVKGEEEGEAGEVKMLDAPVKLERSERGSFTDTRSRPSSRSDAFDTKRDRSQPPTAEDAQPLPRPLLESTIPGRRSTRPIESNRTHDLPRKLSPPRHQLSSTLPSRPDLDTRNGHRESPRLSTRPLPTDPPRSDSRTSHSRYGHGDRVQEPPYEQPHRHPRPHERPELIDRDERSSRREHDSRHAYDERRGGEREPRPDREARPDYVRGSEREMRGSDREYSRSQYEPTDRKRPDLVDDRRSTPSASSRSAPAPVEAAGINPERAALINNNEGRTGISIRGQAQEKTRSSRQSSPRREDDRRHAVRPERTERTERVERPERPERPDRPDRPERSERSDRPERLERSERRQEHARPSTSSTMYPRTGGSNNFGREPRQYHEPVIDMQHGRLEPESPNRPLPRSERSAPEPDTPSGPRGRASGPKTKPSQLSNAPPSPAAKAPERPPPTGPAKHSRGSSSFEPAPTASTQDTSGVHPDRMNLVTAQDAPRPPSRPPPLNTQTAPPSGPRNGSMIPPSGPSPSARGPPTGPQMDGPGRGRRHPLATVNNTLAQASGPSGRGRGGSRQSGGPFPPPQSPVQGSRPDFGQPDPSNPNGVPVQPRPQPGRRESSRDARHEEDNRTPRNRPERERRDEGRLDESRRSDGREQGYREQRGFKSGPHEDMPPRKHHREDSGHFPAGLARGSGRIPSENKRPRRGA